MKTLTLSESMNMGWVLLQDARIKLEFVEARFIGSCLLELGGKPNEGWRWTGQRFVKDEDVSGK